MGESRAKKWGRGSSEGQDRSIGGSEGRMIPLAFGIKLFQRTPRLGRANFISLFEKGSAQLVFANFYYRLWLTAWHV